MNPGQEKFFNYILERIKEDKVDEARVLLLDNFKKQAEGKFAKDDILNFIPKMISMLKPDKVDEVKEVMEKFSKSFNH